MRTTLIRSTAVAVFAAGLLAAPLVQAKGILRATISTSLNQLDPAKHTIGDEYIYGVLVFGGLVAIDENL